MYAEGEPGPEGDLKRVGKKHRRDSLPGRGKRLTP